MAVCCRRERLEARLAERKRRRQQYLDREELMLSPDGVQQYGVGSRSLTRYNTDLKAVQDMIKQLDDEIAELEGLLCGRKPRKAVGVVPRDDW